MAIAASAAISPSAWIRASARRSSAGDRARAEPPIVLFRVSSRSSVSGLEHRRMPRDSIVGGVTPDPKRRSAPADPAATPADAPQFNGAEILARQGIPVLATSAPDLSGVIGSIRAVAGRLGVGETGERLARALEIRREAVRRRTRQKGRPTAVLLIWPAPPQAAGEGTFGGDILSTAGGENCVSRKGWPVLSPEFLVEAACSVIVYPLEQGTRATFITRFLPLAYTSCTAAIHNIHPEMEDAVRILGGGRLVVI
jgi:hypothetical protein